MRRWKKAALVLVLATLSPASCGDERKAQVASALAEKSGASPALDAKSPKLPTSARVVVIDPGHGGSNLGAASVEPGVYEKHITLAIAEKLADRLTARGIRAVLTRSTDTYLTLLERSQLAHDYRAERFVSLHANASAHRTAFGYETYVLSLDAVDVYAPALRRNHGPHRGAISPLANRVLNDSEQTTAAEASWSFADAVQHSLAELRGPRGNRGVKQGRHDVLLGTTMPAVLVEVGFIDHPIEGEALLVEATQDEIADAIAKAIEKDLCGKSGGCAKLPS